MEHCDKHGPYSVFCRACDLETIEKYSPLAMTGTPPMKEAEQVERLSLKIAPLLPTNMSDWAMRDAAERIAKHIIAGHLSASPSTDRVEALEEAAKLVETGDLMTLAVKHRVPARTDGQDTPILWARRVLAKAIRALTTSSPQTPRELSNGTKR